jgi:hypothetical protein
MKQTQMQQPSIKFRIDVIGKPCNVSVDQVKALRFGFKDSVLIYLCQALASHSLRSQTNKPSKFRMLCLKNKAIKEKDNNVKKCAEVRSDNSAAEPKIYNVTGHLKSSIVNRQYLSASGGFNYRPVGINNLHGEVFFIQGGIWGKSCKTFRASKSHDRGPILDNPIGISIRVSFASLEACRQTVLIF